MGAGGVRHNEQTGGVIWLHALVILLIWMSPLLFRWPIIMLGIALYYAQIIFLGDCILTKRQFDTKNAASLSTIT